MVGRKALQLEIGELTDRLRYQEQANETQRKSLETEAAERARLATAADEQLTEMREAWEHQLKEAKAQAEADLLGVTENNRAAIELREANAVADRQKMQGQIDSYKRSCDNWRDQCEALHAQMQEALHRVAWEYCPRTQTFEVPALDLSASLNRKTGKWDVLDSRNSEVEARSASYRTVELIARFRREERLQAFDAFDAE